MRLSRIALFPIALLALSAQAEQMLPLYLRPPRPPSIALLTPNALFYSTTPEAPQCAGKGVFRVAANGEESAIDPSLCVVSLESFLDGVVITHLGAGSEALFTYWDDKKLALATNMESWLADLPGIRAQLSGLLWARGDEELNGQGKTASRTPLRRLFFRKSNRGTALLLAFRSETISALAKSELPFRDESSVTLHPSLKLGGEIPGDVIPVGDDFSFVSLPSSPRELAVLENGTYFLLRTDSARPESKNEVLEGSVREKATKPSSLDAKDLLALSPGPDNSLIVSRSLGIFLHARGNKLPSWQTVGKNKRLTGACGNIAVIQAGERNYDLIFRQEIESTGEWEGLKLGTFAQMGEWLCRDNELFAIAKQFVPYLRAGHLSLDLVVADIKNKTQTNDPSAIAIFTNRSNLNQYVLPPATLEGRTAPVMGDLKAEARLFVIKDKALRLVRLPPPRRTFRNIKDIGQSKGSAVEVSLFDEANSQENGYHLIVEQAGRKVTPKFAGEAPASRKEAP